jgi:hypothetical protein
VKTIPTLVLALPLALGVSPLAVQAEDTAAVNEVLRLKKGGVLGETTVLNPYRVRPAMVPNDTHPFRRAWSPAGKRLRAPLPYIANLPELKITMTVAARTVGGQAQRPETQPANKE